MRISPLTAYTGANLQPQNKNVSFGLIQDERTENLLPATEKQKNYLRKHDAVTIKSEGSNVKAEINKGFEKVYNLLNYKNSDKPNYLVGLEEEEQFGDFYRRLQFCDDDRNDVKPLDLGTSSRSKESAYDQAYYDGKLQL